MDPVSQVLAQQASGSAGGQGFGQFFAQGRQLQQNQQRLNLSSRHLELQQAQEQRLQRRDDMLVPLESQMLQMRIANEGMNLVTEKNNLQVATSMRAGSLAVANLMAELESQGGWGSAESWQAYQRIIDQTPLAAISKEGQLFIQQQRLANGVKQMTKQFGAPTQATVPNSFGGTSQFGNDPLAARRVEISEANLQARVKELELSAQRLENQMPPEQREKLRAGLRAIANDPLVIDSNEKLKRMDDFIQKFQGGTTPVAPFKKPVTDPSDPLGLFAE